MFGRPDLDHAFSKYIECKSTNACAHRHSQSNGSVEEVVIRQVRSERKFCSSRSRLDPEMTYTCLSSKLRLRLHCDPRLQLSYNQILLEC